MERFVPYAKLSKKKKREFDLKKRGSWGALNPVTRREGDPRAYNRKKARSLRETDGCGPFLYTSSSTTRLQASL
ncbi:MAG: hypothetical protein IKE62_04520 [Oscillospiraceae bacterium]|nr:hypothetical protein [Oscillospiraceae bacterium]